MSRLLIAVAALTSLLAAGSASYQDSISQWQQQRDTKLRAPDSWLTLVGLFWLKPGDNTIGSAETNDFVLPKSSALPRIGTLHLAGGKVTFKGTDGALRTLSYDAEKPDLVRSGSVSFFVIQRGDRFAVRAKDSQSLTLKNFTGMKYFPINPELHFAASFIPNARKVPILNVLGQTEMQDSPGLVEFTFKGEKFRLRPLYEDQTLFFLFKDPTNRTRTYQAGRMLNTPLPANGKVDLDFNHSYNPPCTFTPYATCPLPPKENTLSFPVEAGELRYGKGHVEYAQP